MSLERAHAFLNMLSDPKNEDKRLALGDAVFEEIVAAGKSAGYDFTPAELEDILGRSREHLHSTWAGFHR